MTLAKRLLTPALVLTAVAVAAPALAQSSANERNFVYMGKSASNVVMVSGVPARPSTGQVQIWVWHFFGPEHERSTAAGAFGRAISMTVDCSDRTSINRASEQYNGTAFANRSSLSEVATWSRHAENTLGALPIRAVCDAAPTTPRPVFTDLAAARTYADLRLKPSPAT